MEVIDLTKRETKYRLTAELRGQTWVSINLRYADSIPEVLLKSKEDDLSRQTEEDFVSKVLVISDNILVIKITMSSGQIHQWIYKYETYLS